MIITIPKPQRELSDGDLIALTKEGKFIGYGTVEAVLDSSVMLDIDKRVNKLMNELFGESIPFSLEVF
ncbi:MAG TPA: hypothetical protein VF941_06400 [Clostridia bacterium]